MSNRTRARPPAIGGCGGQRNLRRSLLGEHIVEQRTHESATKRLRSHIDPRIRRSSWVASPNKIRPRPLRSVFDSVRVVKRAPRTAPRRTAMPVRTKSPASNCPTAEWPMTPKSQEKTTT